METTMGEGSSRADSSEAPTRRIKGRTTLDIFAERVIASGDDVALRRKVDGTWRSSTWNEWDRAAREIAGGLVELGVELGDRVVILATTRAEWVEADIGILMAGAVTVPIYPSNTPEQCEYIISDSGAKVVIVEDPHQLEKLYHADVRDQLSAVGKVIYMADVAALDKPDGQGRTRPSLDDVLPDGGDDERLLALDELRERGAAWLDHNDGKLAEIDAKVLPSQTLTIVYTSGTTGPPKGVVLTHNNMSFTCDSLRELLELSAADEQLMFLPLAHIFAKILEWASITVGASIAFAESISQLVANLQEVKPTFMGAVPRVYEKAYVKIQSNFAEKRKKAVPRALINWAVKQGKRRSQLLCAGKPATDLSIRLADKLVFSKVQATFGGRLRFFISGGAPLAGEIAAFFHQSGLLVLEGYGLTETTAVCNVNRPSSYRFGTVGEAIPGVEVKIAEDGEVLMRGGNIMKGYHNQPEATAEALDADGWFHSGDIGVIEDDGKLRITDRKKDLIVTAGGKNVAPQNIENSLKALCPYLSQVMVYGDKRKYLSALLTLSEDNAQSWAKQEGITAEGLAELSANGKVASLIKGYVDDLNGRLASYETIKKYKILPHDFDQGTGELTPTMKVKRKFCTEKYADILASFYPTDDSSSL